MGFLSSITNRANGLSGNMFGGNGFQAVMDPMNIFGTNIPNDPNVQQSIELGREIARENQQIARDQLQFNRDRAARFDPRFEEALDLQSQIAREQHARSGEDRDRFNTTFRPIEDSLAKEAMEFDTDARREELAGMAASDVEQASGRSMETLRRDAARSGINPNDGAFMDAMANNAMDTTAMRVGAANNARVQARNEGRSMKAAVSNMGRGLGAQSLAADSLALNGTGAMTGTTGTAIMAPGAAANQAVPWMQGAASANQGAGALGLGQFGVIQNNRTARQGQGFDLMGDVMGMVGGMAMSSKKVKKDKEPVDAALILEGLEEIPVQAWKYKDGDGRKRVGPYAEDVNDEFGDSAAPGGEMIDLVSMNGILLAGVKELAKKVKKLESGEGMHMVSRVRRSTEPRRHA